VTLIITRHGESLNNLPGSTWIPDPDLSPRGLSQARLLGERFAGTHIDALVTSPLLRTLRTANEISVCKNGMPVHILHELVEIGTDYPTRSYARAQEICPAVLPYEDTAGPGDYGDSYGLAIKDPYYLLSRGLRVISRVRQMFEPGSAVVLVGHVGINQRLLAAALRISLPPGLKIAQDNTCVNVIEYSAGEDGREAVRLVMLNDTSHLQDGLNT